MRKLREDRDLDANRTLVELDNLTKSYGDKTVLHAVSLTIREGEFLTLLGPSGCGKTTILRLLAGFEAPNQGTVKIDDESIDHLPPNSRPVNTVFQSYALFPHMTVFDNVAFGLKMARVAPAEIRRRVEEVLRMVRLEEFTGRKPHQLSGGQQQRVAIARAVVNRPRVLLLDECLNALDYKLRKEMQVELKQWQRRLGMTFVFVTHDQEEALSMSDRVVVMNDGRIEQIGTPRQVYEDPANLFVARFVGESNIFDGVAGKRIDPRTLAATVEGLPCTLRSERDLPPGTPIKVLLRPEDLRLHEVPVTGVPANALRGRIVERNYKGMTLDSVIELDGGKRLQASEFFDEDDPSFDYAIGEPVAVTWVPNWEVVLPDE